MSEPAAELKDYATHRDEDEALLTTHNEKKEEDSSNLAMVSGEQEGNDGLPPMHFPKKRKKSKIRENTKKIRESQSSHTTSFPLDDLRFTNLNLESTKLIDIQLASLHPSFEPNEGDPIYTKNQVRHGTRAVKFERLLMKGLEEYDSILQCVACYEGYWKNEKYADNIRNAQHLRHQLMDRLLYLCFGFSSKNEASSHGVALLMALSESDTTTLEKIKKDLKIRYLTHCGAALSQCCFTDIVSTSNSPSALRFGSSRLISPTGIPDTLEGVCQKSQDNPWGLLPAEELRNRGVDLYENILRGIYLLMESGNMKVGNKTVNVQKWSSSNYAIDLFNYILQAYQPTVKIDDRLLITLYSEFKGVPVTIYSLDCFTGTLGVNKTLSHKPLLLNPCVGSYLYLVAHNYKFGLLEPVARAKNNKVVTLAELISNETLWKASSDNARIAKRPLFEDTKQLAEIRGLKCSSCEKRRLKKNRTKTQASIPVEQIESKPSILDDEKSLEEPTIHIKPEPQNEIVNIGVPTPSINWTILDYVRSKFTSKMERVTADGTTKLKDEHRTNGSSVMIDTTPKGLGWSLGVGFIEAYSMARNLAQTVGSIWKVRSTKKIIFRENWTHCSLYTSALKPGITNALKTRMMTVSPLLLIEDEPKSSECCIIASLGETAQTKKNRPFGLKDIVPVSPLSKVSESLNFSWSDKSTGSSVECEDIHLVNNAFLKVYILGSILNIFPSFCTPKLLRGKQLISSHVLLKKPSNYPSFWPKRFLELKRAAKYLEYSSDDVDSLSVHLSDDEAHYSSTSSEDTNENQLPSVIETNHRDCILDIYYLNNTSIYTLDLDEVQISLRLNAVMQPRGNSSESHPLDLWTYSVLEQRKSNSMRDGLTLMIRLPSDVYAVAYYSNRGYGFEVNNEAFDNNQQETQHPQKILERGESIDSSSNVESPMVKIMSKHYDIPHWKPTTQLGDVTKGITLIGFKRPGTVTPLTLNITRALEDCYREHIHADDHLPSDNKDEYIGDTCLLNFKEDAKIYIVCTTAGDPAVMGIEYQERLKDIYSSLIVAETAT